MTQHAILTTALGRWLNVSEIETLLNPNTTILPLSTSPPSTPPPSGSLFLYNRSVTRNYKDDGYKWIKKRNSHKVREDHVKLRVGGKFRVSGCYVHGSDVPSLHRRAYHLLDPDTGTALYPVSNSSSRNNKPSLVLVHYLDTKLASQYTANLMKSKSLSPSISNVMNTTPPQNGNMVQSFNYSAANSLPTEVSSSSPSHLNSYLPTIPANVNTSPRHGSFSSLSRGVSDICMNPADMHSSASSNLGLETLDFLWDVIFTEGEDKLEQTLANSNLPLDPSMIKEMIDVKEEGQDTSSQATGALPYQNNILINSADPNIEHHAELSGNEVMAEIVDITPNIALINRQTNVVISCNEPILNPENNQNGGSFAWYTLAAFVSVTEEIEHANPRAISIDLFKAKRLNPYTYKSEVSPISQQENRHIVVVAVFLDSSTDPVCKGVAASIGHVLEQSWRVNRRSGEKSSKSWLHLSASSHPVVKDRPFIRFLTQMCEDPFRFAAPKAEQNVHFTPTIMDSNDLPAPPSHMALVATVLSDFPNPPVKAVLPPLTTMSFTGPNDKQQTKPLCEITDDSPETKRIIQDSMEATVHENDPTSKKRPNSSIEIGPSAVVDVPVAASAWASKPSSVPTVDTKADEVDRHCKIRFVERLTDVIAEAGPSTTQAVDNDKFKSMDDEELDDILDGLLVRIVESLDEISSSSSDVKEELDVEDKSGFALLHYAAFYNLSSVISMLLSRGANPDIQTSRGNLTPLHLACGAGNAKIVELLVSNGCTINLPDSFGSYPVDHAMRNGFTAVAEFLLARIKKEEALKSATLETNSDCVANANATTVGISGGYEQERVLIQSAFANLSLKDKLIFNMMVRKRRRGDRTESGHNPPILEGDDEEDNDEDNDDNSPSGQPITTTEHGGEIFDSNGDVKMKSCGEMGGGKCLKKVKNKMRQSKGETWEEDSVDSVISNSDKESLNIAMKLMNTEELDDIHRKSADDNVDFREWMMKRNYESLMEAKQNLHKTLVKHGENKGKSCIAGGVKDNAATVRSLKNMKSQALAGLVIRKNVTKRKPPAEQRPRVIKDETGE